MRIFKKWYVRHLLWLLAALLMIAGAPTPTATPQAGNPDEPSLQVVGAEDGLSVELSDDEVPDTYTGKQGVVVFYDPGDAVDARIDNGVTLRFSVVLEKYEIVHQDESCLKNGAGGNSAGGDNAGGDSAGGDSAEYYTFKIKDVDYCLALKAAAPDTPAASAPGPFIAPREVSRFPLTFTVEPREKLSATGEGTLEPATGEGTPEPATGEGTPEPATGEDTVEPEPLSELSGHLVVKAVDEYGMLPVTPAIHPLTMSLKPDGTALDGLLEDVFGWLSPKITWLSLIFAAAFVYFAANNTLSQYNEDDKEGRGNSAVQTRQTSEEKTKLTLGKLLGRRMGLAEYKPTESWASTLVAAGAILTTVLEVLPENPTLLEEETFNGLNVFFAILVVAAGFVYTATIRPDESAPNKKDLRGYVGWFLFASMLTVWAALGELATVAVLFEEMRLAQSIPLAAFLPILVFLLLALLVVTPMYVLTRVPKTIMEQDLTAQQQELLIKKARCDALADMSDAVDQAQKDLQGGASSDVAVKALAAKLDEMLAEFKGAFGQDDPDRSYTWLKGFVNWLVSDLLGIISDARAKEEILRRTLLGVAAGCGKAAAMLDDGEPYWEAFDTLQDELVEVLAATDREDEESKQGDKASDVRKITESLQEWSDGEEWGGAPQVEEDSGRRLPERRERQPERTSSWSLL